MATIDPSWQVFTGYFGEFMKVLRELGRRDWYVDGQYVTFIGHYHAGIYAQVYKGHWHNYTLDGVHYELGFTSESIATKSVRFDLHIGHRNLFDRAAFNELTVSRMAEIAAAWEGEYRFSASNLSDRVHFTQPFRKSKFATDIADGFERLSAFGDVIDDGLRRLVAKT